MKRTFKILGIIFGSIITLIIIAGLVFIYGSNYISAKYEIENPIYEADKIWTFKAEFYDLEDSLNRIDTIMLTTYNQRFLLFQNKVTWSLKKGKKEVQQTTGIIEDNKKIWLHPPRFEDYYDFTEYSAFPEIRKPVSIGNKWNTQMILGTYATKESGSKMEVKYIIERIDTLTKNPLNREVIILGQGISGLGLYKNLMTFTDELGFTKMKYTKENGEKLIIELIDITERN